MRVLMVAPVLDYGGQERFVVDLSVALIERGDQVVVACSPSPLFEAALRSAEVPHEVVLRTCKQLDFSSVRELRRLARRFAPDVVHLQGARAGVLGVPASFGLSPGVVWQFHLTTGNLVDGQGSRARAKRLAYRAGEAILAVGCDSTVGVSEAVTSRISTLPLLSRDHAQTIRNGIPFVSPQRERIAMRRELGLGEGEIVVGIVARLNRQKAVHVYLKALAKLRQRHGNVRGLIVGDGELRADLERLSRAQGLDDVVTFLGYRSDVTDVMQALDVFCLSSDYEGLPLSVLEAMSQGLPVVATDVDGNRDAVRQASTGFLVPAGDSEAMASALDQLVLDAGLRHAMGRAARDRYASEFSHGVMVEKFARLYEAVAPATRFSKSA